MSLKLSMMGQQDSINATPDVVLVGDPGTDQPVLTTAGYLGGKVMAIASGSNLSGVAVIVPCDADSASPFATLMNGPGEFSGAIGPSGSRKAPVTRGLWQGTVDSQAYDTNATFTLGVYVYCGGTTHSNIGLYTSAALKGTLSGNPAIGICSHPPTASEPWLGIVSLL